MESQSAVQSPLSLSPPQFSRRRMLLIGFLVLCALTVVSIIRSQKDLLANGMTGYGSTFSGLTTAAAPPPGVTREATEEALEEAVEEAVERPRKETRVGGPRDIPARRCAARSRRRSRRAPRRACLQSRAPAWAGRGRRWRRRPSLPRSRTPDGHAPQCQTSGHARSG